MGHLQKAARVKGKGGSFPLFPRRLSSARGQTHAGRYSAAHLEGDMGADLERHRVEAVVSSVLRALYQTVAQQAR